MEKILVISASGLGGTIMFTPTLRVIRGYFSSAQIVFLGINASFVAPVEGSELVDEVLVFDFAKNSLLAIGKLWSRLKFIYTLHRRRFDYSFTVFPSNKWYFNLFAWLVHARHRVTHAYKVAPFATLSWLQNVKVPVCPKLHDVDQNLNLLRVINADPAKSERKLSFQVSAADDDWARHFVQQNIDASKVMIGMHVGSSRDYSFAAKRWPTERFAKLADRISQELGGQVVVFAGPAEQIDVDKMTALMKTKPVVVNASLKHVAALVGKCQLFISNDSGLMHLAVAMGVPLVAIFGPTSLTRTRPYTDRATVVYDPSHHSILKYPFQTTSAKIDPGAAKRCFERVTVERVFEAVKERLTKIYK